MNFSTLFTILLAALSMEMTTLLAKSAPGIVGSVLLPVGGPVGGLVPSLGRLCVWMYQYHHQSSPGVKSQFLNTLVVSD